MKETVMQGKPYAGNPHVRFDEGAGASRHSRRSALLYKINKILGGLKIVALLAMSEVVHGAELVTNGVSWVYTVNDATKNFVTLDKGSTPLEGTTTVDDSLIPWEFTIDGTRYTVTEVGSEAFHGKSWLVGTLTFPDSVTSLGSRAFRKSKVSGVTTFGGITTMADRVLDGCTLKGGLPALTKVSSIGYAAFCDCSVEGYVVLHSAVKELGDNTFSQCKITGIDLPKGMTTIGTGVFYANPIPELTLPDTVKTIGGRLVSFNTKVTTFVFPRSVTTIGKEAFWGCTNLKAVYIPGPPSVNSSEQTYTRVTGTDMFKNDTSLKLVLFGSNTKPENVSQFSVAQSTDCKVFLPDNGFWDGIALGGTSNEAIFYHGFDGEGKSMTFTPTTAKELTDVLGAAADFKSLFGLDVRISVTNALDLTGVQFDAETLAAIPVTFDKFMFKVNSQEQLNDVLAALPDSVTVGIDPSSAGKAELAIPDGDKHNVWVLLPTSGKYRPYIGGMNIILR